MIKRRFYIFLLSLAIPVLILFLTQVSSSQQNKPQNNTIKIGVASMITPVDAVTYYQEIIDYIGEQIKQPVQMVHRRTYEEMDSLL
ncbi:MAG: hypothetical protein M1353_08445, partial [Nitrospirae bacterium]|nr:hypothetical protein [Nitrospirota bacterium]